MDSADGSAGEGFGSDVSDACTGGYAGESGVGDECDVLAVGEVFECCSDLVDLFHAGAEGAAASEDHDVASFDLERLVAGLDGSGGVAFGGEDAGVAGVAVDAVVIDDCWVDCGGLDDGAFWRKVAGGECDGAGEAFGFGAVGGHDDVVGIDAVDVSEVVAHVLSALGVFPPVEVLVEGLSGCGHDRCVEEAEFAEVEHDLGYTAGGVELRGWVSDGTVGEDIDDAGNVVVDASPVVDVHSVASGSVGDCGRVQEEIGGASTCRVDDHGVFERGVGEDVAGFDAAVFGHDEGASGSDSDVEPCGGSAG